MPGQGRHTHTEVGDSDIAYIHTFTSCEVEPVRWFRVALNFKGHQRHKSRDSHTLTWTNSWLYSLAQIRELIPASVNLSIKLWKHMKMHLGKCNWKENQWHSVDSRLVWRYLTCCQPASNKAAFENISWYILSSTPINILQLWFEAVQWLRL